MYDIVKDLSWSVKVTHRADVDLLLTRGGGHLASAGVAAHLRS